MSQFFEIDEHRANQLANEINSNGFAKLDGVFSAQRLEQLRSYIEHEAEQHKGEYFSYHGEQALAGSLLASLGAAPEFKALLANLHRNGTGRAAHSDQIFPVLRCVQGISGLKESNYFHYDATVVTALVPICIPQEGEDRGDLVVFPNLRKVRSSVLLNIIEKALVQTPLSRKLITSAIQRGWLKPDTLQLVPGNIYFFWGYRSLHANLACNPELRRATALFHFGDPHADSFATRLIRMLNQRRARQVLAKNASTRS